MSVSRRTFNPGSIHVYVWYAASSSLTKCIWQSAISQHQFYLDRKQARLRGGAGLRTLKEIARDLTRSSASLSSASSTSNVSLNGSAASLAHNNHHVGDLDGELAEEARRARQEMMRSQAADITRLQARQSLTLQGNSVSVNQSHSVMSRLDTGHKVQYSGSGRCQKNNSGTQNHKD